jgi:hypothetical protein
LHRVVNKVETIPVTTKGNPLPGENGFGRAICAIVRRSRYRVAALTNNPADLHNNFNARHPLCGPHDFLPAGGMAFLPQHNPIRGACLIRSKLMDYEEIGRLAVAMHRARTLVLKWMSEQPQSAKASAREAPHYETYQIASKEFFNALQASDVTYGSITARPISTAGERDPVKRRQPTLVIIGR